MDAVPARSLPALSCAVAAGLALLCLSDCKVAAETAAKRAGNAAAPARRQRRIIVNDDGGLRVGANVMRRFQGVINTQVDSYVLCVGQTSVGSAPGVDGTPGLDNTQAWWFARNKPPGLDALTRAHLSTAREAGLEIIASIRMNDIHDAWADELVYPLKTQRPDLLLGAPGAYPEDALMRAFWSGFNYAEAEVRDHFRDFILSYCGIYDYDGVELDYFRHPLFFKLGEEQENLDNMTEFVRQVRAGLDEIGRRRGRPYLLSARVPDTPAQALSTGLDVEQWLKEGLLDLLVIGGGYMPYTPAYKQFIDLAHNYDVPAYPCINHFHTADLKGRDPIHLRSLASNFWALGADGVYIFNYFGVPAGSEKHSCLSQMGDPRTLAGLDKSYVPDNGCSVFYCGYTNTAPQFPKRLIGGTPIEVVVGDDLEKAANEGILDEVRLEVRVADMGENEGITIKVNGSALPADSIRRVDVQTFHAAVTAPPLQRGINRITVLPGRGSTGRLASSVTGLELAVRYKRP